MVGQKTFERAGQWLFGVGILLSFLTLGSFLGRFHWIPDVLTHFQLQLAAGLGICLFVLFFLDGWRRRALWLLPALLANGLVLAPYFWPAAEAGTAGDGPQLTVVTINAHAENLERQKIVDYLAGSEADLVFISEFQPELMALLAEGGVTGRQFPYVHAAPRRRTYGQAVLSRYPLLAVDETTEREGRRVVMLDVRVDAPGGAVRLIGGHPLPPFNSRYVAGRAAELEEMGRRAAGAGEPLIVTGDFNAAPWSAPMRPLLADSGLRHAALGHGIAATWRYGPLRAPLDHTLVSADWRVVSYDVDADIGSDHYPVRVVLQR